MKKKKKSDRVRRPVIIRDFGRQERDARGDFVNVKICRFSLLEILIEIGYACMRS